LLGSGDVPAITMQLGDQPDGRATVLYRFQRPYFAGEVDTELFTGYHEIQGQVPVSERICVVMSLPVARVFGGFESNRTILGNVYLGINQRLSPRGPAVSAGAFLPTAGDTHREEGLVAVFSDPHHYHRFYPDLLTLHLDVAQSFVARSGMYVRGELGPDLWLPVGDRSGRDAELLLHYGIGVGMRGARWDGGVEFVGWFIATAGRATFSEASSHVVSVGVEYKGDAVTPGVFASLPTDEAFDLVDWLLGVRLKVALD
jgi:hypothetical protein